MNEDSDLALFTLEGADRTVPASVAFGSRVRVARERKGVQKAQLAESVEKSPKIDGQWESGKSGMRAKTLGELAAEVGFPKQFFLDPRPLPTVTSANFRVTLETANYLLERFSSYAVIVGLMLQMVARWTALPVLELPRVPVNLDEDGETPESAADRVRRTSIRPGAPIPNVVAMAESLGVLVVFGPPEIRAVDAYSVWVDGRPLIVLNPMHSALRLRIDCAHELGHLVMHDELTDDPDNEGRKIREDQAQRFARALLMPPSDGLRSRLDRGVRTYGYVSLSNIQSAWGVEISEALTYAIRLDPSIADLAGQRSREANKPSSKSEIARLMDRRSPERVTLLPNLLAKAADMARTPLLDLAYEDGIPARYTRLIASRTPTEPGINLHA